jgi:phenylacetic acid degradation operon negative regulatory protein
MTSQIELQDWHEPLSARTLALAFLSTSALPMRAAALIEHAAVFGIEPAAMRMALGRLVRDDMVRQVDRGVYAIGPAAAALHAKARGWAQAEARVRPWGGRWIMVLVEHLRRTDRRQVRVRERALRLGGFATTGAGAWVRPDNLDRGLPQVAADLASLGLDAEAVVLADVRALPDEDARLRALWPVARLEAAYRHWIAEMQASFVRLEGATPAQGARETLLLGQSVLRAINADPLLPAEMVDTGLRRELVETMLRYDAVGKGYWAGLF